MTEVGNSKIVIQWTPGGSG